MKDKRKSGVLTAEDRALWDAFSRAVAPVKIKPRVTDGSSAAIVNADSRETMPLSAAEDRSGGAARKRTRAVRPTPPVGGPPPQTKPVPLAAFDKRAVKKLSKGRREIDSRLDLHGMRQAEAHAALRGFLHAAVRNGHGTVLVITGKGKPVSDDGPWRFDESSSGRGILRRQVPMWLAEPDLRALVVSFTTAHVRHGGDGAFYVQLRRKNGKGRDRVPSRP